MAGGQEQVAVVLRPADDGQVIPGFDAGVMGMQIDQTKIIIVPPDQGYTTQGHALYGKTLYFELNMVDIS